MMELFFPGFYTQKFGDVQKIGVWSIALLFSFEKLQYSAKTLVSIVFSYEMDHHKIFNFLYGDILRKNLVIIFLLVFVSLVYWGLLSDAAYYRSERENTARLHIKILMDRHADEFVAFYKLAARAQNPPDIGAIQQDLGSRMDDFWGHPPRIARSKNELVLTSAGPDGEFDTADDTTVRRSLE